MNNIKNLDATVDFDSLYSHSEIMRIKDAIEENIQPLWTRFTWEILKSILWSLAGVLITYISYVCTPGNSFVVFYGMVIYGVIRLFKTLFLIPEIRDDAERMRQQMWLSCGCKSYWKYY